MSRATLRAAVVSTFGAGNVAGITDVYPGQKKFTSGDEFYKNDGDHSGCLSYVFIEKEKEARRSIGGWKKISYDVGLVLQYRHNGVDPSDVLDAGVQAIEEWDVLLENLKIAVRDHTNGRTLGGAVFQIGEGDTLSGDDIEVLSDLPSTNEDNGHIHIWGVVRFKVIEWVQT